MQNPKPRTFAELSQLLDERNKNHGILPHNDKRLSTCEIRNPVVNTAASGFNAGREIRKLNNN